MVQAGSGCWLVAPCGGAHHCCFVLTVLFTMDVFWACTFAACLLCDGMGEARHAHSPGNRCPFSLTTNWVLSERAVRVPVCVSPFRVGCSKESQQQHKYKTEARSELLACSPSWVQLQLLP